MNKIKSNTMKKHFLLASTIFLLTCFNPFGTTVVLGQHTLITDFTSSSTFLGNNPQADQNVISIGGILYGMTYLGGKSNMGTIFKVAPDGTGYAKLFDFGDFAFQSNGSGPRGSLISDGTFLYGMTYHGGTFGFGVIFKIKPDGTGFTKLFDFAGTSNGSNPYGSLISDGTFLYGMTQKGGTYNYGTIFKIRPDGTDFSSLRENIPSNFSGKYPYGALIFDGNFLYGMTSEGGQYNMGTLFKIQPDGNGFAILLDFAGPTRGKTPLGSLISDGTFLYGMTSKGGTKDLGTIFKIKSDGTDFAKLLDFEGFVNGGFPNGSLISDGTFLYGMTTEGGANSIGTLFKILPDGNGFSKLLEFAGAVNGGRPFGSLISEGSFLYGMTSYGGTNNLGTILKIKPDGTGFGKLLDFADFEGAANGKNPGGSLISDGTFLYGMTREGGTNNLGTIFKVKSDGTGFAKLIDFSSLAKGSSPEGSLISDGIFLYGMTKKGGINDMGTTFKIMPDGTGFAKLLDFSGVVNGKTPTGSLISDGTFLYGMTSAGGTKDFGTIFKIKPDGTGFIKLLDFNGAANGSSPRGSLISDGTFLYGVTLSGGTNNFGTIFKINPDGTGFAKLLDFTGATNGSSPSGSLISDGIFLYGLTQQGGTNNFGTLFKIMPDGTGFTKLPDFSLATNGKYPRGSLISDGTFLYGMTREGGANNFGTLFRIMLDGTGFAKLLDFATVATGILPEGSLISDGNFLYGMTSGGGTANVGTVFKYQIGTTTDIHKVTDITAQLAVYPNPNSGSFTIHAATEGVYAILNELGQTIKIVKLNAENKNSMMVDNLSNGIYFITGMQNGITSRQKIVVMN